MESPLGSRGGGEGYKIYTRVPHGRAMSGVPTGMPPFRPCACVRDNIVEKIKATFNSVFKLYFPRSKSYFPSTAAGS